MSHGHVQNIGRALKKENLSLRKRRLAQGKVCLQNVIQNPGKFWHLTVFRTPYSEGYSVALLSVAKSVTLREHFVYFFTARIIREKVVLFRLR